MAVRKLLMWVALQPRAMVMLDLAVAKGLVWVCGPDVVVVICVNVWGSCYHWRPWGCPETGSLAVTMSVSKGSIPTGAMSFSETYVAIRIQGNVWPRLYLGHFPAKPGLCVNVNGYCCYWGLCRDPQSRLTPETMLMFEGHAASPSPPWPYRSEWPVLPPRVMMSSGLEVL